MGATHIPIGQRCVQCASLQGSESNKFRHCVGVQSDFCRSAVTESCEDSHREISVGAPLSLPA